LCYQSINNPG